MELVLTFATAFLLAIALIPLVVKYAPIMGLIDMPGDERKVHTQPIPRVGGIGIVLSAFIAISYWIMPLGELWSELWGLCVGSFVIVAFGFVDDRSDLNYKLKFLGQILAILPLLMSGIFFETVPLLGSATAPIWVSLPLSFFFMLGVINAVNLTDGLDGLAAGIMVLSLAMVVALSAQSGQNDVALVAVGVCGGLVGFLRFNTHPARVFMGDTGSQFLGFIVAALAIKVTQHDAIAVSRILPLLLVGLPVMDTFLVIFIRLYQGLPPFQADKNHTHHQMMALGFRHYEAVAMIYLSQAVLLTLAWVFRYENDGVLLGVYLLFCGVFLGSIWQGRQKGWLLHHDQLPVDYEKRNRLFRRFDWFRLHSSRVVELLLGLFFIVVVFCVETATQGLSNIALGLAAGGGLLWLLQSFTRLSSTAVTRVLVYSAGVVLVYAQLIDNVDHPVFNVVIDVYLVVTLFVLLLAIRTTRREEFRLDTQDLLVLLFVLIVPLLPLQSFTDIALGRLALRFAVLLYCCEFLLGKHVHDCRLLNMATIASMVLLARLA